MELYQDMENEFVPNYTQIFSIGDDSFSEDADKTM